MGEHLAAHRPHAASALLGRLVERRFDRVLDPFEVVRVDQIGLPEFGCGSGEFAEYQRTAEVAAAGHILLGHQVHPVAQRGDQHDVAGHEERDEFVAGDRAMDVVHHRAADLAVFAVDVADLALDVFAQLLVALDPFAARRGELNQHGVVTFDASLGK